MTMESSQPSKARTRLFWPLALALLLVDCSTKRMVEASLPVAGVPHRVLDDLVRFTLEYNKAGAMSIGFGQYGRWVLIGMSLAVLVTIAANFGRVMRTGSLAVSGLALVAGGAVGNLLDRLKSARGVVDFIDLGIGTSRFYVFNVADVGVCVGAALLAFALWRADAATRE
jgi:signal peptidase II